MTMIIWLGVLWMTTETMRPVVRVLPRSRSSAILAALAGLLALAMAAGCDSAAGGHQGGQDGVTATPPRP